MATNKPKVMLPHTMSKSGIDLMRSRDDIEMVIYPAGIPQADLLPQLKDCAGIALSGTPYKKTEMDASPAMQVVARIGVGFGIDRYHAHAESSCRAGDATGDLAAVGYEYLGKQSVPSPVLGTESM